jgi:acyl-CoA synthetase (AMP-forming)/AMP-acid ligase II
MYGLTECKRVAYLPPEEIDGRPGSVGKAMPNTEAYVVNETGQRAKPGEIGQLVVRGSHVMLGYWRDPETSARVLRPDALPYQRILHTGDLFRSDEQGYLYFVGRTDDIIKSRGEKVSPREVEDVIHRLDGVVEVAVVGAKDPVLGQAIHAFVTARDGAELNSAMVKAHCAQHLESFMVPTHVEIRTDLPRTAVGKIDRRALEGEAAAAGHV